MLFTVSSSACVAVLVPAPGYNGLSRRSLPELLPDDIPARWIPPDAQAFHDLRRRTIS